MVGGYEEDHAYDEDRECQHEHDLKPGVFADTDFLPCVRVGDFYFFYLFRGASPSFPFLFDADLTVLETVTYRLGGGRSVH